MSNSWAFDRAQRAYDNATPPEWDEPELTEEKIEDRQPSQEAYWDAKYDSMVNGD